jgi:hypothetical protein
MFSSVIVPVLPEIAAHILTGLETEVYLLYSDQECIRDITPTCRSIEVAPILDKTGMILENRSVYLRSADPER